MELHEGIKLETDLGVKVTETFEIIAHLVHCHVMCPYFLHDFLRDYKHFLCVSVNFPTE